jgi:hypothetical protein
VSDFPYVPGTPGRNQAPEIERFFDGLDLVDPGVVSLPRWRPDPSDEPNQVTDAEVSVYGGVAHKR